MRRNILFSRSESKAKDGELLFRNDASSYHVVSASNHPSLYDVPKIFLIFFYLFFFPFRGILILHSSSTENLCSRSRALIRAITPARAFPPFLPSRPHKYTRRGEEEQRERVAAAGGVRWQCPRRKTAKSHCRWGERRIRSTGIRDFKTNISRVNPAWMYLSLLSGTSPQRGNVVEMPRGKRAKQITDVLLYIFPAELSRPRREGKKTRPDQDKNTQSNKTDV